MYNQNFKSSTPAPGGGVVDQEKARKRSGFQREIIMREVDLRRSVGEKAKLEVEIRQLKNDEAHIKVSLQERQMRISKLEQDILRADTDLKEYKKKLNEL